MLIVCLESNDYDYYDREYRNQIGGGDSAYSRRDYEMDNRGRVPFELYGNVNMRDYADYNRQYDYDSMMDYGGDETLSDRELMDWSKKLLKEVPEQYKNYFSLENMEKKAKEMGIEFKDFSFSEFYTTVLMMVTDYSKTLGMSNIDIYMRLAKDWLCDEDSSLQYGKKLSAYYDSVIEG